MIVSAFPTCHTQSQSLTVRSSNESLETLVHGSKNNKESTHQDVPHLAGGQPFLALIHCGLDQGFEFFPIKSAGLVNVLQHTQRFRY